MRQGQDQIWGALQLAVSTKQLGKLNKTPKQFSKRNTRRPWKSSS